MQKNSKKGLTTREVVVFAMLGALMLASKTLLESVPNIHPVTMLLMVYTAVYGKKAIFPLLIYLVLDTAKWGILSMFPYFYIFPLCYLCTLMVPTNISDKKRQFFYTVICTSFGLFFGVLYAPWQALIHFKSFTDGRIFAWIAAGFTYDLLHAAGNFAASFLILPLEKLIKRIDKR
ncbi:MAG: hypothetical protein IJC81_01005 [Clostridia bacterium]|nr:hypothetical protein [Clostridia bacterium]